MWFLRRMLRTPPTAKKTNERVLNEANKRRSLVRTIQKHHATFLGHVMRWEKLEHLVSKGKLEGKISRGRQREKITDGLATWLGPPDWEDLSPAFEADPTKRKRIKDLIPHRQLLDVNFWSEDQLILARCTGAVSVVSSEDLYNMLGKSPEWYEPSPQITQALNGGFLGMECEIRFSKKRMTLVEDDDADDSDEEDLALMSRAWRRSKHAFLYFFTDNEMLHPPRRKPRHVTKCYRIVSLKSTTPEDLYARKIDAEEYGEALALAQAYGLDCDLVYQRQWRTSPVSKASIQDYLSKISKRAWVLHECLERVPENIDAMTELLQYGLNGTDLPALLTVGRGEDGGRFILCDPDEGLYEEVYDEFNPESMRAKERKRAEIRQSYLNQVDFASLNLEQKEICRARLKFLQYLDRLKTYECILGGPSVAAERYNSKFYTAFRSRSIYELTAEYAQNNDWRAVETMLTYHSQELAPHRLAILSNFPETADPSDYTSLLPEIRDDDTIVPWETDTWRDQDWAELPGCRKAVELGYEDDALFLYSNLDNKYRTEVLNRHLVEEWYSERACEIERRSCLVDYAIELVKQGIQKGAENLSELLDDLVVLEMIVYECCIDDSLTLVQLWEMADYDRLEYIMSKSSEEMYTKNLRRWVIPFLQKCEQGQAGAYDRLLRDFVLTKARHDLTDVLKIFQISKTTLSSPLIRTSTELMSLALDALYSCSRDDQLDLAVKIFECLPSHSHDSSGDAVENARLHKQVDHLEQHICAARIFEANGMKKTLAYIKSSENDPEESRSLIVKLTRMASKRSLPLNELEWMKLNEDVMTLQAKVYRCISRAICREIFVESLMCSGRQDTIRLAGQMLERSSVEPKPSRSSQRGAAGVDKVPYARAVELALSAAREYFDSSANLSDPCMDLARSCLNLILDAPPAIQEELDLIASLALLNEFGVAVLPLQVRLSKDRLELVRKAVVSKPTGYKQTQRLLRLGQLLGIPSTDDIEREGQIVQMCAEAAVNAIDYEFAHQYCSRLIDLCYSEGWAVCVKLAQQEGFRNIDAKSKLLSFALTYCSNNMIQPILQATALLESQMLYEQVNKAVRGGENSNHLNHQATVAPVSTTKSNSNSNSTSQNQDSSQEADDRPASSRESPFSARAAIKQTQQILSSTKRTTTSVLSTITDHKWWASAVTSLQGLSSSDRTGQEESKADGDDGNAGFKKQACHPFYASIMGDCYEDTRLADYNCAAREPRHQDRLLSLSILRTAKLEEMLTHGETQQPATEALLDLARYTLPRDTTLGLAYLLALPKGSQNEVASNCFEELPSTDISLQVAVYYYALRIYSSVTNCSGTAGLGHHADPLYRQAPSKVIGRVLDYLALVKEREEEGSKVDVGLVEKLEQYQEMLEDYNQACTLQGLGKGVDVLRFAEDPDYKQETIFGLAMSLDEEVYSISLSLAQRYGLSMWDVYMCHLEFLFSDSGLSMEDLQARVSKLGILPTLKERSSEFTKRMMARVYPTLDGTDLKGLTYFFSLLLESDQEKVLQGLTASEHSALLKKLKGPCPGVDYKRLMDEATPPVAVLKPCLTATNVNAVAKLATQIPDKSGGFLHPSSLYGTWAAHVFWTGEDRKKPTPDSMAGWVHRYEAIGELIQRLRPEDLITLVDNLVFTNQARSTLDIPCREEITKRALKFSRQGSGSGGAGKKKKQEDCGTMTWETCRQELQTRLTHLKSLGNDTIQSFAQAEDPTFCAYAERYDLSKGDLTQIELLLVQLILDGHAVELVDDILQVAPPSALRTHSVVRRAVSLIVAALRGQPLDPGVSASKSWLEVLQMVVENVREHQDNGGDLVKAEDVMSLLRTFCSDASIEVPPRLDVLRVVEKSFELSATDTMLLTLYRTDALVSQSWSHIEVTEEKISTEESRLTMFSHLLSESQDAQHFITLCRILVLWPQFSPEIRSDPDRSPWVTTFHAILTTQGAEAESVLDFVLRKECIVFPLDSKCCRHVVDNYLQSGKSRVAVKLVLHSKHQELYDEALSHLATVSEGADDSELLRLLLETKLTPCVVSMPVFPALVAFVLQSQDQDDSPPVASPQDVARQLADAGFEAEAGSLLLQCRSSHSLLQTFSSALASASHWLSVSEK
ncbi:neuroblastoma-amplified sequence-like [Plakobranchus ocellatus]|uniref:Neuroblastoma-amplified sequence-like n=1 Tax=Plakobranchus ocellatus TaxID=259542 RepID=A0AAV3YC73_9GAST|nr:neuroblastoma-amplified sequence-like [Plakobranchus ocellatus]